MGFGYVPPIATDIAANLRINNMSVDLYSALVVPQPPPVNFDRPPLRLGIMASGDGSNFSAIATAIQHQALNAQIAVLIHNKPGIKAIERATQYQVPTVLHHHHDFASREDLDAAIVQTLHSYQVDCVVMAGWMRVVTAVLIDAFPERLINIHPSLLPSFPGIRAIEQALAAQVKITGCTAHLVSLAVDSGPILIQAAVPVLPHDHRDTLHARIQAQEHHILPAAIQLLANGLRWS
jgi:phosphoribosylglycinamide formyltransferase 1